MHALGRGPAEGRPAVGGNLIYAGNMPCIYDRQLIKIGFMTEEEKMLNRWMYGMYFKATEGIRRMLREEEGDTNFISILIILGIVILLAGVFIGFKDQIIGMVNNIVGNFVIR